MILISLCQSVPSSSGGSLTPRDRARLIGRDGHDFWQGKAAVVTLRGTDVSEQYRCSGLEALKIVKLFSCRRVIFKANSPSCGCGCIFNEAISGLISGEGTTSRSTQGKRDRDFQQNRLFRPSMPGRRKAQWN